MSKRIFDMGRSREEDWRWRDFVGRWAFTEHYGEVLRDKPTTEEQEITRLREIICEKDARIESLERQLGLRR